MAPTSCGSNVPEESVSNNENMCWRSSSGTLMQSQSSTTDVVKKILGTFDRLDLDPHSILTRLEMSQIIQTMAEKLTDKETNALIDELEVNEDGDVTFDQLIYHMFSDKDQASNF